MVFTLLVDWLRNDAWQNFGPSQLFNLIQDLKRLVKEESAFDSKADSEKRAWNLNSFFVWKIVTTFPLFSLSSSKLDDQGTVKQHS